MVKAIMMEMAIHEAISVVRRPIESSTGMSESLKRATSRLTMWCR
jgi:hypothetical protein